MKKQKNQYQACYKELKAQIIGFELFLIKYFLLPVQMFQHQ